MAAFAAVSEAGSFGRAAERLGYTQSAVSHQVAMLERIVGHRLFDRRAGRGPVALTEAGIVFADHAAATLGRLSCARADLDALGAGASGSVRVGAFQSVSARLLPELIQRLSRGEHSIDVELTESASDDELLAALAFGDLDFAFTLLPVDESEFATTELLSDPYYLAASPEHRDRLTIESLTDLADTPIVAPRSCRSWARIAARMQAVGVEPRYAFRTDDNFALKALVQSGIGVAFVTRLMLEVMGDGLDVVAVEHLLPSRRIALVWSRHRSVSELQRRFMSVTQEACEALRRDPLAAAERPGAPQRRGR